MRHLNLLLKHRHGAWFEIASRWVRALPDAYAGRVDVAEALRAAAADIDELVAA